MTLEEKQDRKITMLTGRNKKLTEQLGLMRKHFNILPKQGWYISYLQDNIRLLEEQNAELQTNLLKLSTEFTKREARYKHAHIGEVHIKGILR